MKTKPGLLLIFIALTLIFASCRPQAKSSPLSAALSELAGKVELKQAGQDSFTPASAESPLEVNGQVQTGDDGRVRLDLSSGTIIRVAPSSLFTLTSNDEVEDGLATKINLQLGKIFIILNGGSADVETPSGVASVRGSYMKVQVDSLTHNVYITCLEGDCSASNEEGTVEFTAGEKTILFPRDSAGNWIMPTVGQMTPEEFQEWLDENPEAQELFDLAIATITALAEPTEPPATEPAVIESVVPPADNSSACFKTIQPASGTSFSNNKGKINFEWESQTGAQKYIVTFTDRYGNSAILETTGTSLEKYIEILPNGGDYEWKVTAYGEDGNEICTTDSASFSKPQGEPTPKPTREPEPEGPDAPVCTEYNYDCQSPCVDPVYSSTYCSGY